MRTGIYAIEFIMEDGYTQSRKVYVINSSRNIDRDYKSTINKIIKGEYENDIFKKNKVNVNNYKFIMLEEIGMGSYDVTNWKEERKERLEELKEKYTEEFVSDGHMVIDNEKIYFVMKPRIITMKSKK